MLRRKKNTHSYPLLLPSNHCIPPTTKNHLLSYWIYYKIIQLRIMICNVHAKQYCYGHIGSRKVKNQSHYKLMQNCAWKGKSLMLLNLISDYMMLMTEGQNRFFRRISFNSLLNLKREKKLINKGNEENPERRITC